MASPHHIQQIAHRRGGWGAAGQGVDRRGDRVAVSAGRQIPRRRVFGGGVLRGDIDVEPAAFVFAAMARRGMMRGRAEADVALRAVHLLVDAQNGQIRVVAKTRGVVDPHIGDGCDGRTEAECGFKDLL